MQPDELIEQLQPLIGKDIRASARRNRHDDFHGCICQGIKYLSEPERVWPEYDIMLIRRQADDRFPDRGSVIPSAQIIKVEYSDQFVVNGKTWQWCNLFYRERAENPTAVMGILMRIEAKD